jgi:hypothetical protein
MIPDYVKTVKAAALEVWADEHPLWDAVLEVDEDFDPKAGRRQVLIADDGGPALLGGAWLVPNTPYRTVLRLTSFADGRTAARDTVLAAAQFVRTRRPGIVRVEGISVPLLTRDKETGADLGSVTMPVIVHQ